MLRDKVYVKRYVKSFFYSILLLFLIQFFYFPIYGCSSSYAYTTNHSIFKLDLAAFAVNVNKTPGTFQKKLPTGIPFLYSGNIKSVNTASLKLNDGQTFAITGDTICRAPVAGVIKFHVISCSSLYVGETVRITAIKNSNGQYKAKIIQKTFY